MKFESVFQSEVFFLAQVSDFVVQQDIVASVVADKHGKQSDKQVDMVIDRRVVAT